MSINPYQDEINELERMKRRFLMPKGRDVWKARCLSLAISALSESDPGDIDVKEDDLNLIEVVEPIPACCFNCEHSEMVDGSFENGTLQCKLNGRYHDLMSQFGCLHFALKRDEEEKQDGALDYQSDCPSKYANSAVEDKEIAKEKKSKWQVPEGGPHGIISFNYIDPKD
jgi:hypothetical protein